MDTSRPLRNKTRVLYIVESFSTGVFAIVRDIACNLDSDKFEVKIIHSLRGDSPRDYIKEFSYPNIFLEFVDMNGLRTYLPALKKIKNIIKEFQPITIHLHSSKAGVIGRLASRKFNINLLYSPHGFAFLRTDVKPFIRYIFFQIEKFIDRIKPAKIITVSNGELAEAKKITRDTALINNFVDVDAISLIRRNEEYSTDVITTGRISPQKNPALFNEIALKLPNLTFTWIGDGPLRNVLTAENISITGFVPRAQAIEMVRDAKIYLQTSLWEGMPVSILEAMAAGKAIVATNIIGNRDLLENENTGFLCIPSQVDIFVERILLLENNYTLRNNIGTNAYRYVLAHHDLKQAIRAYEVLYQG